MKIINVNWWGLVYILLFLKDNFVFLPLSQKCFFCVLKTEIVNIFCVVLMKIEGNIFKVVLLKMSGDKKIPSKVCRGF
ncbi:hypothetical protein [Iodobacter fluviatilis]|uniref:hypothetical protein n=1 Tax=Iodobacter fluviatilis TaxID=537 RepID=UPI000E1C2FAE|nr:hypothetical protein [Iodobacter fluviatilis]